MISTVTAITVSTIVSSSMASSTLIGMGSALALVAIVTLLVLLIEKEVLSASQGPRAKALSFALNIGLTPLLIAFAVIVVTKAGELVNR